MFSKSMKFIRRTIMNKPNVNEFYSPTDLARTALTSGACSSDTAARIKAGDRKLYNQILNPVSKGTPIKPAQKKL